VGGDPESGTINYRYDAAGNLVWRDDNMGRQTCYSYDALNRVTQKIYFTGNYATQGGNCAAVPGSAYLADSPTVSYSYDSANISYGTGRLAKVTNGISDNDNSFLLCGERARSKNASTRCWARSRRQTGSARH
jgi:YD repeat-containing protein